MTKRLFLFLIPAVTMLACVSCKTAYYGAMETVGVAKRDILVDRVEDARNAQAVAQKQFQDALERFGSVVEYDGGDLEKEYKKLNKAYEKSEKEAQQVRDRIDAVESVSKDLFKEWNKELSEYASQELRQASKQQFNATKQQYDALMVTMRNAAASMDPVLTAFGDQVLFLKHNLNSRAIAGIQGEADKIQMQVNDLIREMENSIAEADAFIKQMGM
jgi:hypothetical protein